MKKLGFSQGDSICADTTPSWYSQFANDKRLVLSAELPATHAHMFFSSKVELSDFLKDNDMQGIEKSLWVSWPKKSSGVKADITEQDFREKILRTGWVDVKVAAIDETWSGLKFLRRKMT